MSSQQILRREAVGAVFSTNGTKRSPKKLREYLIKNLQYKEEEISAIWGRWESAGKIDLIFKHASEKLDAQVNAWLWKQTEMFKKNTETIVNKSTSHLLKALSPKFKKEFQNMSQDILKKNIKKIRHSTVIDPPDEKELDEALEIDDVVPEDVSGPEPVTPVATASYHVFFGPDGRRILEEIQVPIVTDLFRSAEILESVAQSDLMKIGSNEALSVNSTSKKKKNKKEKEADFNRGVVDEVCDEVFELDEESEFNDRDDPKSLVGDDFLPAPSNPKVEELKKYVASLESTSSPTALLSHIDNQGVPALEVQKSLLSNFKDPLSEALSQRDADISNSVMISARTLEENQHLFPQYALMCASQNEEALPLFSFQRMGRALSSFADHTDRADPRLFINTNHPWSFFVCGLQGSGKSHSTSCLLESCLIPTPLLGRLQRPLSGLVFHFSQYASASAFQPCEAAFLAVPHPDFAAHQPRRVPTTVLVSPSNYHNLKAAYAGIPGVKVKKLQLHPKSLNISTMLSLMAVATGDKVPLYMTQIQLVLREMATKNRTFNYMEFLDELKQLKLTKAQLGPLGQRLRLLESFLDLDAKDEDWKGPDQIFSQEEGAMTIIDLSCPFVDEELACVLFNICLGMFLETPSVGKVVAVDEAHKYITGTPASKELTESLISLIRQQRHFGVRVIVSTQEPTVDPRLIELSNVTLMHRFTSPEWFARLKKHIGIGKADNGHVDHEVFNKIVNLRTGEAYVFAPSAMTGKDGFEKLGGKLLKVKTRKRVTWDGGRSILSVD